MALPLLGHRSLALVAAARGLAVLEGLDRVFLAGGKAVPQRLPGGRPIGWSEARLCDRSVRDVPGRFPERAPVQPEG